MQYLALDLGNVVLHVDMSPVFEKMQKFGYSYKLTQKILDEYEKPSYIGLTNLIDYMVKRVSPSLVNEIANIWDTCITINPLMENFILKLRKKGTRIAALSNIGQLHGSFLKNDENFVKLFDILHFSYDVGSYKPQKLFFQSFLLENPEFTGCVYLDDRPENVESAKHYKFNAISFDLDDLSTMPKIFKQTLDDIKEMVLNRSS